MEKGILDFKLIGTLPPSDEKRADELLKKEQSDFTKKIIVIDDDPTGVQTVHGIHVYTDWEESCIRDGFADPGRMFYILSNSRSFTKEKTIIEHRRMCETIAKVAKEFDRDYLIISRSDSTLRGHYPTETEVIKECMEEYSAVQIDGEILYPFFLEGGRYTLNNIHYVKEGDKLVPAGQTEFAQDKTFGYKNSYLPDYIEEKTAGRFKAEDTVCISLEDLRVCNVEGITRQLMQVKNFNKVIVNSADYTDVKVFCTALMRAIKSGKNFVFRTAACFAKVIGGVADRPLLTREELVQADNTNGGLIMVGSHMKKSTEQLKQLMQIKSVQFIEFDSGLVLQGDEALEGETGRVTEKVNRLIQSGKTVCVYTGRKRIDLNTGNAEDELKMATKISDSVTAVVSGLTARPKFIIAKGGITSSDIGTRGLCVKKALVAGQIRPGIPVWITGDESKFSGMAYVIFPGNAGEPSSLRDIVQELL